MIQKNKESDYASSYRPLKNSMVRKIVSKVFFNDDVKAVHGIDLSKTGIRSTVKPKDKPKNITWNGEASCKKWFENSPGGHGYFDQELYNKIKDAQKYI